MATFYTDIVGTYSLELSGSLIISGSEYSYGSVNTTAGSNIVIAYDTASYTAAFFNYLASSGSNARAGHIASVWNNTSMSYNEVVTTDIGNTDQVNMSVTIDGGSVKLNVQTETPDWKIKSSINLI